MDEFKNGNERVAKAVSDVKEVIDKHTTFDGEDEEKESFMADIKGFIKDLLLTVVIVFFVISFVAQPTTVDGHSMNPTLEDKDQLIIEKISQRFAGFKRFDIVVFPYLKEENKYFIKRVIGLPGETINIIDGQIFINDVLLDEPIDFDLIEDYGSNILPVIIPDGHYFVVGDNRNHSKDSRYTDVGFVNGDDILGKGYIRLYPFNGFGFIE